MGGQIRDDWQKETMEGDECKGWTIFFKVMKIGVKKCYNLDLAKGGNNYLDMGGKKKKTDKIKLFLLNELKLIQ